MIVEVLLRLRVPEGMKPEDLEEVLRHLRGMLHDGQFRRHALPALQLLSTGDGSIEVLDTKLVQQ